MKKILVFVIFAIILGAASCGRISNLVTKSDSNSDSATSSNPVTASGNPREDVIKASKKFTEQQSFLATMDGSGSKDMHMELEYIAPDRYRIKTSAEMEAVILGKDTYLKTGGAWKKFPMNLGDSIAKMRDSLTEEGMKSLKDVEYLGEDAVNGKNALLYKYKGDTVKEKTVYTSRLWVGKDNGLPLKIEVEYPAGSILKQMTTIYDYDTKVTIESPIAN
jgi:outer membrane lipoprotein-sorting protein